MQSTLFIPETMIKLPNWIFWKLEKNKDGKPTKIPYYVARDPFENDRFIIRHASSTDPDTWRSFEEVVRYHSSHNDFSGIGFVLDPEAELVFIDVDHCLDQDGRPDDRAHDFLSSLNGIAFCEVSQSGEGLHFFVKGTIPRSFKNPSNGVEMYSQKRYCAVTGNAILRNEPDRNQEVLDCLFARYKTPDKENDVVQRKPSENALDVSDTTLLRMAKKNARFSQLWEGDISMYSSHSEADLSLCGKLAFWCDCDMNRMDSLFRMSGLYRKKWERADYRTSTLQKACAECKETFSEFIRRKDLEEVNALEKCFLSE